MRVQDFESQLMLFWAIVLVISAVVVMLPLLGDRGRLTSLMIWMLVLYNWASEVVRYQDGTVGGVIIASGIIWTLVLAPLLSWSVSTLRNRDRVVP